MNNRPALSFLDFGVSSIPVMKPTPIAPPFVSSIPVPTFMPPPKAGTIATSHFSTIIASPFMQPYVSTTVTFPLIRTQPLVRTMVTPIVPPYANTTINQSPTHPPLLTSTTGPVTPSGLLFAIRTKNVNEVKLILSKLKNELLNVSIEGDNLIGHAAMVGDFEIFKSLHQAGANLDILKKNRNTLLHIAAEYGHVQIIEYLFEHSKIDIDVLNTHGYTALKRAIKSNHTDVVELLLKKGAIPIAPMYSGKFAAKSELEIAREYDNKKIIELLEQAIHSHEESIKDSRKRKNSDFTTTQKRKKHKHEETPNKIFQIKIQSVDFFHNILFGDEIELVAIKNICLYYNRLAELKVIFSNSNSSTTTTITSSSFFSSTVENITKELLTDDMKYQQASELMELFNADQLDENKAIEFYSKLHDKEKTNLSFLVDNPYNQEIIDIDSPLITDTLLGAIKINDVISVRIILKYLINYFDLNVIIDDATFIGHASIYDHVEIIECFIQSGANPIVAKNRMSPLHLAAKHGSTNSIIYFLEKKIINIDRTNNHGETPLTFATKFDQKDAVEIFLNYGANPHALPYKNENVKTPYQVAIDRGEQSIIDLYDEPERKDSPNSDEPLQEETHQDSNSAPKLKLKLISFINIDTAIYQYISDDLTLKEYFNNPSKIQKLVEIYADNRVELKKAITEITNYIFITLTSADLITETDGSKQIFLSKKTLDTILTFASQQLQNESLPFKKKNIVRKSTWEYECVEIIANLLRFRLLLEIKNSNIIFCSNPITKEEAIADFEKLQDYESKILNPMHLTLNGKIGTKAANFFTRPLREKVYRTIPKLCNDKSLAYTPTPSPYALYNHVTDTEMRVLATHIYSIIKIKYQNFFKFESEKNWLRADDLTSIDIVRTISKNYLVGQFSSTFCFDILHLLKILFGYELPKTYTGEPAGVVLDCCGGWGGRLAAFLALVGIIEYIAIDPNQELETPYEEFRKLFAPNKKVKFINKKVEEVDNKKDIGKTCHIMLTCPPYGELEKYLQEMKYRTDDEINGINYGINQRTEMLEWGGFNIVVYGIIGTLDNVLKDLPQIYVDSLQESQFLRCYGIYPIINSKDYVIFTRKVATLGNIFAEPTDYTVIENNTNTETNTMEVESTIPVPKFHELAFFHNILRGENIDFLEIKNWDYQTRFNQLKDIYGMIDLYQLINSSSSASTNNHFEAELAIARVNKDTENYPQSTFTLMQLLNNDQFDSDLAIDFLLSLNSEEKQNLFLFIDYLNKFISTALPQNDLVFPSSFAGTTFSLFDNDMTPLEDDLDNDFYKPKSGF